MKKSLLLAVLCGGLVACNSGGGSSDNSGGGGNNQTDCSLRSNVNVCYSELPYTYTANHTTGETINGYPVGDMRPFGSSLKITYTVTNTNESLPIYFNNGVLYGFYVDWIRNDIPLYNNGSYEFYNGGRSGTCANYTSESPLQPKQSCTFILDLLGQNNFTESELFNFYDTQDAGQPFGFVYYFKNPANGEEWVRGQRMNTYVRAGNINHNQQGYNLGVPESYNQGLGSFNVLNIGGSTANGGHDYIFPTLKGMNSQPFVAQFTESGLAYLDTSAPVACPIPGCLNGTYITPMMYDILWTQSGPQLMTSIYTPSVNDGVNGLNKLSYGRNIDGAIPNVSKLYAVQKDGTIIGQNLNGEYGCFNNDGSGFRAFPALPAGYSWLFDGQAINTQAYDTMSYGDTNWITLINPHGGDSFIKIKVVADNSGICQFDFDNVILNKVVRELNVTALVDQAIQITPNGVYGAYGAVPEMRFYKYPPRE